MEEAVQGNGTMKENENRNKATILPSTLLEKQGEYNSNKGKSAKRRQSNH
jgi:hypothetical protein